MSAIEFSAPTGCSGWLLEAGRQMRRRHARIERDERGAIRYNKDTGLPEVVTTEELTHFFGPSERRRTLMHAMARNDDRRR